MRKITRFFWFCSGAHIDTLKKYPIEHNKYVGIGATIFFTALFASLSGGYAMYFVFSGSPMAVLFAIFFGLLWGLAIFNMDRYIVSSINKQGTINQQIIQASPRILLAIMIGVVISRPLELKIFDKEIRQRLRLAYLHGQKSKIDTLQLSYNKKYSEELDKNKALANERDSLTKDINRSRYQLNQEVFGEKSNQTSGIVGYGAYAKQKQAVLQEKEDRLKVVQGDMDKMDNFLTERKNIDGLNNVTLFSDKQLDSLSNVAGFADRNWALGQLAFKTDGTRDIDTWLAESFIGYLFILFECLPVFVKLMSPKGAYDEAIARIEEANLHFAERDKEHEIAVTDENFDHRLKTDIEKRRQIITGQSEHDLGKQRYD